MCAECADHNDLYNIFHVLYFHELRKPQNIFTRKISKPMVHVFLHMIVHVCLSPLKHILNFMCMFFSAHSQVISKICFLFYLVDPPKVNQHQLAFTGAQVIFKVEATGDDLTFQWLKDGSDVLNDSNYSGTDTNTLMIQHVKKSDGGCYRCLVKNEAKIEGEVSDEVQLIVCECTFYWNRMVRMVDLHMYLACFRYRISSRVVYPS